jgi:hypothetical protein
MVYGSNVLPSDAAYYQLTKAAILDGTLSIKAGGSAKCTLSRAQLNSLPEYFRLSLIPINYTDRYTPKVHVHIDVETADTWYSYTLFPVQSVNGIYVSEIKFNEADYVQFTFEVVAIEDTSFTLWELCPESASNVEVVIDGVKQSLPKLLYDYNTTELVIGQAEQIIGMINCYLIGNTDLQGHFLMKFTATDRCTIHLRFFDSSMIELFSPIVHTVNNGYNTLEVPHAYLKKLIGVHNFYVTAQVTNGSLTVPIRGILYTIDGGYLAERLMNPGMDVCDISLRQLKSDKSPSEIWAIGVDSGNITVKKRVYNLSEPNAAWDAVYVIGEGTLGAIEFDGDWVRRSGEVVHTLETYTLPVIAYVDTNGILWMYQHGMHGDPIQVASNVTCISMVRGYKSKQFPDHDQGLVLCWVQNGNVYYKQYAYFSGSYQWYPTEQLTYTGDVTFVQVHRLNDYRLGIAVQSAAENIWYITGRTYVSQAVPSETFDVSFAGLENFIIMTKEEEEALSFEAVPNAFSDIDAAQSDFYITFTYPAFIELLHGTIDQWKHEMTVTINSTALSVEDYDLTIEGSTLHVHLHRATWGIVQVSWNKANILFYLDSRRYLINTQAKYSFTWNIWKSKSHAQPAENVNAILTGTVTLQYTEVNRPISRQPENVTATLTGVAAFQYIEVNKYKRSYADTIDAALDGDLIFSMILIGEQPI